MQTMPTLVTGATGFIGRRLLNEYTCAMVRQPSGLSNEVTASLEDESLLARACQGMHTVVHCAGYAHAFKGADPRLHWEINAQGTQRLAEAAAQAGVRQFIFLSSVKAMAEPGSQCVHEDWPGEPDSDYGRAKRHAEDVLLDIAARSGMMVTNLRLSMVYGAGGRGNLERMAKAVQAGWFPALPDTGNRRSLVHIHDVVSAIQAVRAQPDLAANQTYIVSHTEAPSGRDLYLALCEVLGMAPKPTLLPAWGWQCAAKLGDLASRLTGRTLPLNSEVVDRLLGSACYASDKLQRELNWQPQVDIHTGLREMLGLG